MSSTLKFTPNCELASLYIKQAVKPHTIFYSRHISIILTTKPENKGDKDDLGDKYLEQIFIKKPDRIFMWLGFFLFLPVNNRMNPMNLMTGQAGFPLIVSSLFAAVSIERQQLFIHISSGQPRSATASEIEP